jgi:hypothetical protein
VVCVGSAALVKMTAKMSRLWSGNRGGQVKSPDVSERGCLLLGLRRFQHLIYSGKEDVFHSARGFCKSKLQIEHVFLIVLFMPEGARGTLDTRSGLLYPRGGPRGFYFVTFVTSHF